MNVLSPLPRRAFTLVELLVVIAIIGLLSSVAVFATNTARAKARDTKRLADMRQIMLALELYKEQYGDYPAISDGDWGGWDEGYISGQAGDTFIQPLVDAGIMSKVPGDPLPSVSIASGGTHMYFYYLYPAGVWGSCPEKTSLGSMYVLAVRDMETTSGFHPTSPGVNCGAYPTASVGEWAVGKFQNE